MRANKKRTVLHFVTYNGVPVYWSERWQRFYAGVSSRRHPTTVQTLWLARRRITRSIANWSQEGQPDVRTHYRTYPVEVPSDA